MHPDVEVLVSTRDSAYAEGRLLGFAELSLTPPEAIDKTVRAVLTSLCPHDVSVESRDAWVGKRANWVMGALQQDHQLQETPLIPVLLALLAADREHDDLPRTRALILSEVVRDVVARREAKRELHLPPAVEGYQSDLLLSLYPSIASKLDQVDPEPSRDLLAADLEEELISDWDLAPGLAAAVARDVLNFWDESGIFVATGGHAVVEARLRLFQEVGAAMSAARMDEGAAQVWIGEALEGGRSEETILLAAGLSRHVAHALIRSLSSRERAVGEVALLAAQAVRQGAEVSDEDLRILVPHLITLVRGGDDSAWQATKRLIPLPVAQDQQAEVISAIESAFPNEHVTVAKASAALSWSWESDRRDQLLEASLSIVQLPKLARRQLGGIKRLEARDWATVDSSLTHVHEEAARSLIPSRPDLLDLVLEVMTNTSLHSMQELSGILHAAGHGEVADARLAESSRLGDSVMRFITSIGQAHAGLLDLVDWLASIGPAGSLSRSQESRMSELATFLETVNLNFAEAWYTVPSVKPLRDKWFRVVMRLGHFDESVLAGQAAMLRQELREEEGRALPALFSLLGVSDQADLRHWGDLPNPEEARQLALTVLKGTRSMALVAADALVFHPDRRGTARAIHDILGDVPQRSKLAAVWAYVYLVDDPNTGAMELSNSPDLAVRAAVAKIGPEPVASTLAADPERSVLLSLLDRARGLGQELSPALKDAIWAIRERGDEAFTCPHCGSLNPADRTSCDNCHVVSESPRVLASEIATAFSDG